MQVNTFSLFGFSQNSQTITDSNINISMQFQVLTGALLCLTCDIEVKRCNFIFSASGQQISGMIIEPRESFTVCQSFVQFRISSMNSSGLTNVVNKSSVIYVVSQCKLTGSNFLQSNNNGYIASAIFVHISLNITQFDVCVDSTARFGQNSVSISTIGSEIIQCDICDQQSVVYGLCCEELKYSENVNGMYQCVYPFEYVNNQCVCSTGYLLNTTMCVNIIESINSISNQIYNSNSQINQLEEKVDNIESSVTVTAQSIVSNMSEIENRIKSNFSKCDYNLFMNTSILNNVIYQNITSVKNDILMKQISADANLFSNTTTLDWRIFNNVSQLQNTMNNFTLYYNDSLLKQIQLIEQQQNIINNLTQQTNCTNQFGYSLINGFCVQVSCAI
ncbi:Growth_factor receptor cysteine-rich domain superfamily [Hexamita inflata]|uniref:Growth factor receptor cysteine-rich domain superfamily n=2 Tax=Hexamita inflata TaxID=28002 RepID=A0AA86NDI1_9EUKA|nr:Growth factor receptor cysteine-rich domain superfamily [Hexamita inflata]